ncbi:MAG TPA: T9SS type A sorting domain-containing protein [Flavisolibacter sp.]|jgi:hypothetical protein|nr:T9SS type A sorting domain-containing protein [Flavisolibacter sp.]
MRIFYSFSRLILVGTFSGFLSNQVHSQATTCASTFAQCIGQVESFDGGGNGFSGTTGGFVYSANAFRVASTNNNTNYQIVSRTFAVPTPGFVNVGFNTSGSTANLGSYTVEILDATTSTVIAACANPSNPSTGPICYTITDNDLTLNRAIIYRITVRTAGGSNNATLVFDNFTNIETAAGPLPVNFTSFTATRKNETVSLKWETASEQNNSTFEVQRKTSGTDFETIASVPSKANGGSSTSLLQYELEDANDFRGTSFYRIRQVDRNGHSTISQVRVVTNKSGSKVLVFPNPSATGSVNISFSSAELRSITLFDNTGRTVKEWKTYAEQDIRISNLKAGTYLLKARTSKTGEENLERIVITH